MPATDEDLLRDLMHRATGDLHARPEITHGIVTASRRRHRRTRALGTLSPQQRAIVVLRYFDDRSEGEVAQLLGVSIGTVKSTASRAVARLRKQPGLGALLATSDTH